MTAAQIRRARPDDLAAIRRVAEESWAHTYRNIIPVESQRAAISGWYSDEALLRSVEAPGTHFLVAEVSGEIVAFAQCDEGRDTAELSRIYVLPQFQRSRVGHRLLSTIIDELRRASIATLATSVESANRGARDFYARCGFASGSNESVELFGCRVDLTRYTLPVADARL